MVTFRDKPSILIQPDSFTIKVEPAVTSEAVQKAVTFLKDNYKLEISLNQLANSANLSKFHFSRIFKKETGMTFREFRAGLRISEAKKLLSTSSKYVSEICYEVGYNDITHFERVFKTKTGSTPTKYRKNLYK